MQTRYTILAIFLCIVFAVGTLGVAGQSPAEFTLESDSTVATPPQTVSNQYTDGELTIRKSVVIEPDELLTGTATVPDPDEQTYFIQFRDSDRRVVDDKLTDGAETPFEFTTSSGSPGSYAVNIWDPDEQVVKSVLPVVIASHEVSSLQVNDASPASADVAPSETAPVNVSLTTLESTTVDKVNVTVWNNDEELSTTLENTATNEYEGTLPALDEGEYQIQVRVRGGETVDGRPSLIGLSDVHTLTVAEPDGSDDNGSNDNGSDDGSDDDGSDDGSDDDGSDDGSDDDNTGSGSEGDGGGDGESSDGSTDGEGTSDDTNTTDGNSTGTDTETGDSTSGESNGTDSAEDDGAISPNDDTVSSDDTENSTPLYAVQMILLSVVLGGALHRVRHDN